MIKTRIPRLQRLLIKMLKKAFPKKDDILY